MAGQQQSRAGRIFVATPTKLTTWLDCPERYRLTYVDRMPKGPPWAHNSVGASLHNALRDWYLLPVPERTPDAAATLVRQDWIDLGFRDAAQSEQWRERAARMAARYVAGLDSTDEPVGVERSVAFRTDHLALNGRADRIDRRTSPEGQEELVVVDYKTGRHLLSVADVRSSLALAIYAVAAARTLRAPCRRVELHHLPSGEVLTWEHDESALQRHIERAHQIAADASRAEREAERRREDDPDAYVADLFPPRRGIQCSYCDLVANCAAGLEETNGELPTPWAVLDVWPPEASAGEPFPAEAARTGRSGSRTSRS